MSRRYANLIAPVIFVVAGFLFLLPASRLLLERNSIVLMGAPGDSITLPFQYHTILETWRRAPLRLLPGAVYTPQLNAPAGWGMWIPRIERIAVLMTAGFVPLASIPTAYYWLLLVLNGLVAYALARSYGWEKALSLALGFAFAFNPYTHSKALGHPSLAATFTLPLALLGLRVLHQGRIALAALFFLICAMGAHYYLMILSLFSPLLLFYYLAGARAEHGRRPTQSFARLAIAVIPAALLLVTDVIAPMPFVATAPGAQTMLGRESEEEAQTFLHYYSATPVQYVAGDTLRPTWEWNLARAAVTRWVQTTAWNINVESENAIRWSLLILFFGALLAFPRGTIDAKFAVVLALTAFWASLSPAMPSIGEHELGLSRLMHRLVPPFRVPARCAPLCHLGVILAVGHFVASRSPRRKTWLTGVLLFFVLVEYLPRPVLDVGQTHRSLASFGAAPAKCGAGLRLPVGRSWELTTFIAVQRLRDGDCTLVNPVNESAQSAKLLENFGYEAFKKAEQSGNYDLLVDAVTAYARSMGLRWYLFDADMDPDLKTRLCAAVSFGVVASELCRGDP